MRKFVSTHLVFKFKFVVEFSYTFLTEKVLPVRQTKTNCKFFLKHSIFINLQKFSFTLGIASVTARKIFTDPRRELHIIIKKKKQLKTELKQY